MESLLQNSVITNLNWVKGENYTGWDPYDALNSNVIKSLTRENRYLEILATQLFLYCPFNLRGLFKISKGIDLKGVAIFARAYAILFNLTNNELYMNELKSCVDIIKEKCIRSQDACWASHYFPYTSADKNIFDMTVPDIIGTSQSILALIDAYRILKDSELKSLAIDGCNYIVKNLLALRHNHYYFKYMGTDNKIVYNASAQGLEALTSLLSIYNNNEYRDVCIKITKQLISNQNKNGSWAYSTYSDGKTRNQLDFHQGFILDGLLEFYQTSDSIHNLEHSLNIGLKFYKKLFYDNGKSFFRYPLKFPVDIHNQAQGIITFSKASIICREYLNIAKNIALWTLNNMQSREGFFYYQYWGLLKNKIPYIRWGQAWMMLAMSNLLKVIRGIFYEIADDRYN